jgi:hypothetical protein
MIKIVIMFVVYWFYVSETLEEIPQNATNAFAPTYN